MRAGTRLNDLPLEVLCEILSKKFTLKDLAQLRTVSKRIETASNEVNRVLIRSACLRCDASGASSLPLALESDHRRRELSSLQVLHFFEGEGHLEADNQCVRTYDLQSVYLCKKSAQLLHKYILFSKGNLREFKYASRSCQDLAALFEALQSCKRLETVEIEAVYESSERLLQVSDRPPCSDQTMQSLKLALCGVPTAVIQNIVSGYKHLQHLGLFCSVGESETVPVTVRLEELKSLTLALDCGVSYHIDRCAKLQSLVCVREGDSMVDGTSVQFKGRFGDLKDVIFENAAWNEAEAVLQKAPNLKTMYFVQDYNGGQGAAMLGTPLEVIMHRLGHSNPALETLHVSIAAFLAPGPPSTTLPVPSLQHLEMCSVKDLSRAVDLKERLVNLLKQCPSLKTLVLEGHVVLDDCIGRTTTWEEVMDLLVLLQATLPSLKIDVSNLMYAQD